MVKEKEESKGGESNRSIEAPGRPNVGQYAWKGVAPKAGESLSKTVNGKEHIHCPHHGDTKWALKVDRKGIEHATGCKKMREGGITSLTATTGNTTPGTPSRDDMRLAQALAHVMEEGAAATPADDDDDEE